MRHIQKHVDWLLVFFCNYLFFYAIVATIPTDIPLHAATVRSVHMGESPYPANFLYYFLVSLFSGFSAEGSHMLRASVVILALAVTMKYVITKGIIRTFFVKKNVDRRLLIFLAVSSLFLFAIPDFYNLFYLKKLYVSRMVPNVWH